jgi:hypothetical protein
MAMLCGLAALLGACGNHFQLDIDSVKGSRDPSGRVVVEADTTCHLMGGVDACEARGGASSPGLCAEARFYPRGTAPSLASPTPATGPAPTALASLTDCHPTKLRHGEPLRFSFTSPAPLPPDVDVQVRIVTTEGGRPEDYERTIVVP